MPTVVDLRASLPKHPTKRWEHRHAPIDCFCVHHSATPPSVTPEAMARYHVEVRGYPGIAYHYVIWPDGTIFHCNDDELFTWHGHDFNTGLDVCLTGDFTDTLPTREQLDAAAWLYREKRKVYGPGLRLVGHREAPRARTECPGRTWGLWRDAILGGAVMRASVLGVQFQGPPELGTPLTTTVRRSRIEVIKAINPHTWHEIPMMMFPLKRVIARIYVHGDEWEHSLMRQGVAGADEYFKTVRPILERLKDGGCVDWLGPNEPHPGLGANVPEDFEYFWRRLIEHYVNLGGKPWVWSFGVGWPKEGMARVFVKSIKMAIEAGGGLEVHEYSAPNIYDGDGWLTLRIKRTLAELYEAGLPQGKERWVLVGECGIAWAVIPGNPDYGWKWWPGKEEGRPQYVYPPQFGLGYGVMDEERYWRHMSWLDDQYREMPEILAATPFITCPQDPRWATFDWGQGLIERSAKKHEQFVWHEAELGRRIGESIQKFVIPLNPSAALYRAAREKDPALMPASDEVPGEKLDPTFPSGIIAQAFRKDADEQWIAWTKIGEWDPAKIRWVKRKN